MKIRKKVAKKIRKATGTETTRKHTTVRKRTPFTADPRDVTSAKDMERRK